jgi:hypothetical protein
MNVLVDDGEEPGTLAHTGFPDDVGMLPAVGEGERERDIFSPAVAQSEVDWIVFVHAQANRHSEGVCPSRSARGVQKMRRNGWRQTVFTSRQGNSGLLGKPIRAAYLESVLSLLYPPAMRRQTKRYAQHFGKLLNRLFS